MTKALVSLLLLAGVCQAGEERKATGYVVPAKAAAEKAPPQPYVPKEGDLIFYDDHNLFWTVLFLWAGTGPPLHVGIVFKKDDGALAVLEAGPDDTIWVKLLDVEKRLPQFAADYKGTITIRQIGR